MKREEELEESMFVFLVAATDTFDRCVGNVRIQDKAKGHDNGASRLCHNCGCQLCA